MTPTVGEDTSVCVRDTVVVVLCFLFVAPPLAAQVGRGGARAVALANAVTALDGQVSGLANPASIASLPSARVALGAARRFGIPELAEVGLSFRFPVKRSVAGLDCERFGFRLLGTYRLRVIWATRLRTQRAVRSSFGVALDAYALSVPGYHGTHTLAVSAGFLLAPGDHIALGMAVSNANRTHRKNNETLPSSLSLGISARAGPSTRLLVAADKAFAFPLSLAAGIETCPAGVLSLRVGMATQPVRFATGVGFYTAGIDIDVSADRHQRLGWTPSFSVTLPL